MDVIEQMYFTKTDQIGKCPLSFYGFLNHGHQQIGNKSTIYLYLNGILIVSEEIFYRKILL